MSLHRLRTSHSEIKQKALEPCKLKVLEELKKLEDTGVFPIHEIREALPVKALLETIKSGERQPPASPKSEFSFEFNYDIIPEKFPDLKNITLPIVREKGVKASIDELAHIFHCKEYKTNFVHYWFLDVITDCIWVCQDKFEFPEDRQKTVLTWILYAFDVIRGN